MTPARIPSAGDRVRVIQAVPPWYFVGEIGEVIRRPPEGEFCELRLANNTLIAHTSHLEVVSR